MRSRNSNRVLEDGPGFQSVNNGILIIENGKNGDIHTTPSGRTSALTWGTSPIRAMYLNMLKVSSVSIHQYGGRLSLYLKISTAIFTFYVAWESLYDTLKVQILATPRAAIWKQSAGRGLIPRPGSTCLC